MFDVIFFVRPTLVNYTLVLVAFASNATMTVISTTLGSGCCGHCQPSHGLTNICRQLFSHLHSVYVMATRMRSVSSAALSGLPPR